MSWPRVLVGACAFVLLLGGLTMLREATESTHYRTDPDSRLRVVVEARSNKAEPSQTIAELTEAHVWFCRLEIRSDPVGELERLPGDRPRFAVVLQPSLDSTDRKQYEGCLEDWTLDHHLLHVVSMEDIGERPTS